MLEEILIINKENNEIKDFVAQMPEYAFISDNSLDNALELIRNNDVTTVLVDSDFPTQEIIDFTMAVKEKYADHISIIVTGDVEEDEEAYLAGGVDDFILKPYKMQIVKYRIKNQLEFQIAIRKAEKLSTTDQLTQLPNRRAFDNFMDEYYERGLVEGVSIALIMMDIDYFKRFNDTYGHDVGDEVLKLVGKTIKSAIKRKSDFVFRWGGEEFIVLLYSADAPLAYEVAEHIRTAVEKTPLNLPGINEQITISLGIMAGNPKKISAAQYEEFADMALYEAKNAGRNRTHIYKR